MKEAELLGIEYRCKQADAGDVGAWPTQACDQTSPDRIGRANEDDRDFGSRGLRRFRRISAAAGEDHSDLTIDQITRQLWQPVIMAFRPTVFDRHVLAFHIAGFL